MKKGRFLWSAHRITEKQKAGKARNIKEKQLKNSRSTVSKPHSSRAAARLMTLEILWMLKRTLVSPAENRPPSAVKTQAPSWCLSTLLSSGMYDAVCPSSAAGLAAATAWASTVWIMVFSSLMLTRWLSGLKHSRDRRVCIIRNCFGGYK